MTDSTNDFISRTMGAKTVCESLKHALCRHLNVLPHMLEVNVSAQRKPNGDESFTLVVGDFKKNAPGAFPMYDGDNSDTHFTQPTRTSPATIVAKHLSEKPGSNIRWDRPLADMDWHISVPGKPADPYKAAFGNFDEFMNAVRNGFPPPETEKPLKTRVAELAIDPATGKTVTTSRTLK